MRVLVTGGAGFIGSNLVWHLAARGGYDIIVLDNLTAGQQSVDLPRGVCHERSDFMDKPTILRCLSKVDVVVHLAALSGVVDSVENPDLSFAVNVAGTFQLLKLARAANVRRIINASSGGAVLGTAVAPFNEEMGASPVSPYGASKLAAEGYCSAFTGSYGLSCVTLRFSNIYGQRSGHKKSAVAAFMKNILRNEPITVYGDGTQRRDYLYVDDLVRGIETALQGNFKGIYQLGSGKPTSLLQLINALGKVTGSSPEIQFKPARAGEVPVTWCDISKAKREMGFSALTNIEEGLRPTWEWFVANHVGKLDL